MKRVTLFIIVLSCLTANLKADIITEVKVNQKKYYVDLRILNTKSEIWFLEKNNASSPGDKKVMTLAIGANTYDEAMKLICENKKYINQSRMVVGCTALAVSTACVIGVGTTGVFPPAGTAAAIVCSSAIAISGLEFPMVDCIAGISSIIAEKLAKAGAWNAAMMAVAIEEKSFIGFIDAAIDEACRIHKQ